MRMGFMHPAVRCRSRSNPRRPRLEARLAGRTRSSGRWRAARCGPGGASAAGGREWNRASRGLLLRPGESEIDALEFRHAAVLVVPDETFHERVRFEVGADLLERPG